MANWNRGVGKQRKKGNSAVRHYCTFDMSSVEDAAIYEELLQLISAVPSLRSLPFATALKTLLMTVKWLLGQSPDDEGLPPVVVEMTEAITAQLEQVLEAETA